MNLKEQLYVCTLAETGNITQAAKLLFISQPALSLYISNLERKVFCIDTGRRTVCRKSQTDVKS